MFWKVVKYALLLVLVASLAIAVYGWLDTAISLNYARQQQKTDEETRELLRKFLLVSNRGVKRREIMQVVQQNLAQGHGVKEEGDRIVVDNVVFRFDDSQSLRDIQFLDTISD